MPYKDSAKQRAAQLKWVHKRREDWIEANGPCQQCGSYKDLEVDHIDPTTKSMHPAQIWGRKESDRSAELAKCQVLCSDCHKKKSKAYHKSQVKHGTYSMRYTHKCTCDECKAYVRNSKAEWRKLNNKN